MRDSSCLTYEAHFGLREKPFSLSPNPRFFFRTRSRGSAVDTLTAGIRRREGILSLTGEVGTGKTTVCKAVLESLDRKTFAAFVPDPFVSREDLLKILLVDFGVVSADDIKTDRLRSASRTELGYTLREFLTSLQPLNAFAVVVIDEAQNLSANLLEEVRILADLEHDGKLLDLVLVGQPELETRLQTPELRQLSQRIAVRVNLDPFGPEDVASYITHRLTIAGNGKIAFDDAAIDYICAGSAGIPRVINLLCDKALTCAAAAGTRGVEAEHVVEAAAELRISLGERTSNTDRPSENQPAEAERSRPPSRRRSTSRQGLPQSYEMRHDAHYVEELEARREDARIVAPPPSAPVKRDLKGIAVAGTTLLLISMSVWAYSMSARRWPSGAGETSRPLSTATIEPVPMPREMPPATDVQPVTPPPRDAGFAIQVATFQGSTRAAESVRELQAAGYEAFDVEVTLRSGDRAHAVFLGPYADRSSAARDFERASQIPGYTAGRIVEVASAEPLARLK